MKKTSINITVDTEAYLRAKSEGINISGVCSEALIKTVMGPEETARRGEDLQRQKEELDRVISETEKQNQAEAGEKQKRVDEFMNETGSSTLNNPAAMGYWTKYTGLSEIELKRLRIGWSEQKH